MIKRQKMKQEKGDIPPPTQSPEMDEQYGSKLDYLARYLMGVE